MSVKEDRFWSKVKRGHGCWNWMRAINTSGYGWVAWNKTQTAAHRVAWEITNGSIPSGMHVLHHCDNTKCVNPSHLYLGTHTDNMRDRADRRRSNHQKLSVRDVSEIRRMRKLGATCQAIADKYGISNSHASCVARGLCYGRE